MKPCHYRRRQSVRGIAWYAGNRCMADEDTASEVSGSRRNFVKNLHMPVWHQTRAHACFPTLLWPPVVNSLERSQEAKVTLENLCVALMASNDATCKFSKATSASCARASVRSLQVFPARLRPHLMKPCYYGANCRIFQRLWKDHHRSPESPPNCVVPCSSDAHSFASNAKARMYANISRVERWKVS